MFPSQRGNFFPSIGRQPAPKLSSRSALGASTGTIIDTQNVHSPGTIDGSQPTSNLMTTLNKLSRQHNSSVATSFPLIFKSNNTDSITVHKGEFKSDPSFNSSQNLTSQIPSPWSNQLTPNESYFEYKLNPFNDASASLNSKEASIANALKNVRKLQPKVQQERLLVKKVCEEALKNRKEAFALVYSKIDTDKLAESQGRIDNYSKENHGRICDFMLKLVTERDQMLQERRGPFSKPTTYHLCEEDDPDARYTPIYCAGGKTLIGKPNENINFPNSFASLLELKDPRNDPDGFKRFCTLVNMKGFEDKELFLRITGRTLAVDGVRLHTKSTEDRPSRGRVYSTYVDLPKGVYPEHLRIGRSMDGILVIQESWKF